MVHFEPISVVWPSSMSACRFWVTRVMQFSMMSTGSMDRAKVSCTGPRVLPAGASLEAITALNIRTP